MTVRYAVDGPGERWRITMGTHRQSSLSREALVWSVTAWRDGKPHDPSSAIVEAAFVIGQSAEPGPEDWKAATWDTSLIKTHVAQCLVGPGGAVQLTRGRYYCWLRITDGAEVVVRQAGILLVD